MQIPIGPKWLMQVIGSLICGVASAQNVVFVEQNWDDSTRQFFYTTSQGSRLVPYEWFLALEQKESTAPFAGEYLEQLGFLRNPRSSQNPDGLPVGFVIDIDSAGNKHLGLNCAACHTNQVQIGNKTYQIDGAPSQADLWPLLEGLELSFNATQQDAEKWLRFSTRVLGNAATAADARRLEGEVDKFLRYYNQFINDSRTPHGWGRARLDAFGMIFNRVSSIDLGEAGNSAPPDAPVSYPFLWGTSWENQVQWNGSAPNTNDIERLGRNVGEVLGVFGHAELEQASLFKPFYRTSARRLNQVRFENHLKQLWSPKWPGSLDQAKLQSGKNLFASNCVRCHEIVPHGDQSRPVIVAMTPLAEVKTDPKMATNAVLRKALTKQLEGSKLPGLDPLPASIATGALLKNVVRGALLSPFRDVEQGEMQLESLADITSVLKQLKSQRFSDEELLAFFKELDLSQDQVSVLLRQFDAKLQRYINDLRIASESATITEGVNAVDGTTIANSQARVLAYKGRPLDGIWATGPYLHNGSVPNLYELLLPADKRSKKFYVGSIELDIEKVGFKTDQTPGSTLLDTSLPGNSNAGHDMYGSFSEEQRWALVEYMKSL